MSENTETVIVHHTDGSRGTHSDVDPARAATMQDNARTDPRVARVERLKAAQR